MEGGIQSGISMTDEGIKLLEGIREVQVLLLPTGGGVRHHLPRYDLAKTITAPHQTVAEVEPALGTDLEVRDGSPPPPGDILVEAGLGLLQIYQRLKNSTSRRRLRTLVSSRN